MNQYERIMDTVGYIAERSSSKPLVGLVLGSGLGEFADSIEEKEVFDFTELPHFRKVRIAGHAGRLIVGRVGSTMVAVLQGRTHYYEGHDISDVVFPVRVLAKMGVQSLLLTNAAGGIGSTLQPGDLMIISDHINLMGINPLRGENDDRLGPRFPDMSHVYDPEFQKTVAAGLVGIGREAKSGIYAGLSGPSYETPAEIRMLKVLGADAVGMSTVPEAICARHMGLRVAGISCITNMAAGISATELNHREVTETAQRVKQDFILLLQKTVPLLS